ncbi:MAG: 50S ribosomal protein L3 [Acidiferrobacterales bacterium]
MPVALIGRKLGMTQMFSEDGAMVAVTVLEVLSNRVTQVRDVSRDGYRAIEVTTGLRQRHLNKPTAGRFAKSGVEPGRGLWQFRLGPDESEGLKPGSEIKVDVFAVGQKVDVQGTTIGKGFAGVMKRHGFGGGRATHGNSLAHRAGGSIGQRTSPGRVFPGKKMAGHMGNVKRTQQNLEVVQVDAERSLLLVKGAVPGARGSDVLIRPAVKAKGASAG